MKSARKWLIIKKYCVWLKSGLLQFGLAKETFWAYVQHSPGPVKLWVEGVEFIAQSAHLTASRSIHFRYACVCLHHPLRQSYRFLRLYRIPISSISIVRIVDYSCASLECVSLMCGLVLCAQTIRCMNRPSFHHEGEGHFWLFKAIGRAPFEFLYAKFALQTVVRLQIEEQTRWPEHSSELHWKILIDQFLKTHTHKSEFSFQNASFDFSIVKFWTLHNSFHCEGVHSLITLFDFFHIWFTQIRRSSLGLRNAGSAILTKDALPGIKWGLSWALCV